jgi:hypothetical protein
MVLAGDLAFDCCKGSDICIGMAWAVKIAFSQSVKARHSERKTFSLPGYKATFSQHQESVV